jgi:2-polyprenyl-6-methoxyphenol hydroxylase-like FAD-dependent oxidoreductase
MHSSRSRHAVIVGAGPAGAVLANLLATRGVRVTLLERQTDFAREFRGEVLVPSGVHVLRSLEMDAVLDRVPGTTPEAFEFYANRSRVLRVDMTRDVRLDPPPRIFSQPALLEAIVSETERRSDLRFERGASVKELSRENGRVSGLRVRTLEGERQIDADLVIGCDGRASVVRRQAALEVESEDPPMDIVWCKIPSPESWNHAKIARFCVGRGQLFVCYVTYDGLLQIGWVIPKGGFGELKRRGIDEWVGEMAEHAPADLSDHLLQSRDRLVHPFLLSTAADHVRDWSVPGALVLGDAAHTMSPVGGQGLNIALRDAVSAANHLVPVLREGGSAESIDAVLRRIEAERKPEVRQIQRMQAMPPKILLRHTWWAEILRQAPKLLRFAPVQRLAGQLAQPFLFGTEELDLRV